MATPNVERRNADANVPNRRTLLAGLAAAPIAALVASSPARAAVVGSVPKTGETPSMSRAWENAMREYEEAERQLTPTFPIVETAEARYHAAARDIRAVKFVVAPGEDEQVAYARYRSERKAVTLYNDELAISTGMKAAIEVQGVASRRETAAMIGLLSTPAPNLSAVLRKIKIAGDAGELDHNIGPIMEDLERLELLS